MLRGQVGSREQIGDLLLFQRVVIAIKPHVLRQHLDGGNKPDENHFGINTYFLNSAGIVVTREDEILMPLFI